MNEQAMHYSVDRGPELKRSIGSGALQTLYSILRCQNRWRVARLVIGLAGRLEGGLWQSWTARQLLKTFHQVEIGAYTYGPCFDPAIAQGPMAVGRYTSIAGGVRFFTRNHPFDERSTHPAFYDARLGFRGEKSEPVEPLVIGDDVWIGANAIITPSCRKIGTGAVVGAGSVVTKEVPPYAVVCGNPARIIRYRFSEPVIQRLLRDKWWKHPVDVAITLDKDVSLSAASNPVGHPALKEVCS